MRFAEVDDKPVPGGGNRLALGATVCISRSRFACIRSAVLLSFAASSAASAPIACLSS